MLSAPSLGKFFNKGLEEGDKKEGILKRLKNIDGRNDEQLKAITVQGEKQLKAITDQSRTGITLLKSIYTNEVKKNHLHNEEAVKIFKKLKNIEANDVDYKNLNYRSGYHILFKFSEYGSLVSLYLVLVNGYIN